MLHQADLLTQAFHLQVQSDLDVLPEIVQWFEQFKQTQLPLKTWLQANIAMIEGFTNAARHAHAGLSITTPIDIEVQFCRQSFGFKIWDYGQPFDFDAALSQLQKLVNDPDFDPLVREKQWGGVIFLKLIHHHGWTIQYLRERDSRNCLRVECPLITA